MFADEEVEMPRLSEAKLADLEGFWRSHPDGRAASSLNQRKYCGSHGLALKLAVEVQMIT